MRAIDIEKMIHSNIPLSKVMGVRVQKVSPGCVEFLLPLKPNRNHHGTAFGGTLMGAQALCAWSFLMAALYRKKQKAIVVIKKSQARFLRPVTQDFRVVCKGSAQEINLFLQKLKAQGRAEIKVKTEVYANQKKCATFLGTYVALGTPTPLKKTLQKKTLQKKTQQKKKR